MSDHYPGLEVHLDERFQRREWRVERVAWVVMGAIIIGAVAGVFGGGPLSESSVSDAEGRLTVYYDRFARREAPITIRLVVQPSLIHNERVRLTFNRDFMEQHRVQSITPAPVTIGAAGERVDYVFAADPERHLIVTMNLNPTRAGRHRCTMTIGDQVSVSFSEFVYP